MTVILLLVACFDDSDSSMASLTAEERHDALEQREMDLSERWKDYDARNKSKEEMALKSANNETETSSTEPSTPMEKGLAVKDSVLETVQKVKDTTEMTKMVVDAIELSIDKEAHLLLEDFSKVRLDIVEVGNHLECQVVSTDGDFALLNPQKYEIEWWHRGVKVTTKASRYCSGATLGIGLNSGGPNCPHHIKGAFYPYMAPIGDREDQDSFQCELSLSRSMMAFLHKKLVETPSAELKSAEVTWSRWSELKLQTGGPWQFKGTEVDCGKDGPQGYTCFEDGLSGW